MSRTKRAVPFWAWTPSQMRGQDHGRWREFRGLNVDYRSGETKPGWASASSISRLQRAANRVKVSQGIQDWMYEKDDEFEMYSYEYYNDLDYLEYIEEEDEEEYPYYEDDPWYFDDFDYSWDVT